MTVIVTRGRCVLCKLPFMHHLGEELYYYTEQIPGLERSINADCFAAHCCAGDRLKRGRRRALVYVAPFLGSIHKQIQAGTILPSLYSSERVSMMWNSPALAASIIPLTFSYMVKTTAWPVGKMENGEGDKIRQK